MQILFDIDWYPPYGKQLEGTEAERKLAVATWHESRAAGVYPLVDEGRTYTAEDSDRMSRELLERSGLGKFGILSSDPEYPMEPEVLPIVDGRIVGKEDSHYREILETYYFQLRNSVQFVLDHTEDIVERPHQLLLQAHRKRALYEAVKLANFQLRTGKVVIPGWLENVFWELETNLSAERLELWRTTSLRLSQKRSFHICVTVESNVLCLPLLLKAHIESLLSSILNVADARSMLGDKFVKREKFAFGYNILSHLWLFYADFSLMNVPHIHSYSITALRNAKRWAHFASLFLVLHELGHFHRRHTRTGIDAEFDADRFALERLLAWKAPDPESIVIAIDYLFQILCLIDFVKGFKVGRPLKWPEDLQSVRRHNRIRRHPEFAKRLTSRGTASIKFSERTIQWFLEMLPSMPAELVSRILREEAGS